MLDNSHKTALTRKKLSAPTRYLQKEDLLRGRVLDFGCGKGFDADAIGADKFDPHYFPVFPTKRYDTIICNYVLNVVWKHLESEILNRIEDRLKDGGVAYLAVRRDVKKDGYTSKGTYQRNVILHLPIVEENKSFCIYEMRA